MSSKPTTRKVVLLVSLTGPDGSFAPGDELTTHEADSLVANGIAREADESIVDAPAPEQPVEPVVEDAPVAEQPAPAKKKPRRAK